MMALLMMVIATPVRLRRCLQSRRLEGLTTSQKFFVKKMTFKSQKHLEITDTAVATALPI